MARGGRRTPANPKAVSGPGAYSQRTDGGPANPILLTTGMDYGDKQRLEQTAAAAPMARTAPATAAAGGRGHAPAGPPLPDMYAPTERPGEPITAGASIGPGRGPLHVPPDDDEALWVAYEKAPSADLLAILEQRRRF